MSGLTRLFSGLLTLLFVTMISVAGSLALFHQAVVAPGPLPEARNVIIPPGDSSRMIAERLEQQGIISGQTIFLAQVISANALARLGGKPQRHMKAGEYEIEANASIQDVIRKLTEGRALLYSVTIPEGLTSHEIVRRLTNDSDLSGTINQVPAEGTMLPETFKVPRNTPRTQVVTLLSKELDEYLNERWEGRAANLPFSTKAEAMVLASLIEKESGPNDDPAQIAGVFVNRLRKGMRLQSDPTILYGKHGPSVNWGAKIFRSDIKRKTAYNTYQIDGLPPTPICNPGRKAIAAALDPAKTENLYFVADGRGGHIFSKTLADHERAVRDWRKIEREIRRKAAAKEASTTAAASSAVAPTLINTKTTKTVDVAAGAAGDIPLPVKRPKR